MKNEPTNERSPQGRRVLIAVVTGEAGERIQRWREQHDPFQARRLPLHTTLCYWVPDVSLAALERQGHPALPEPGSGRLRALPEFGRQARALCVRAPEPAPPNP